MTVPTVLEFDSVSSRDDGHAALPAVTSMMRDPWEWLCTDDQSRPRRFLRDTAKIQSYLPSRQYFDQ